MARVTVEDCILKIPNRFELVMIASQRAREIGTGATILVNKDNDKNPVIALREIADTEISLESLNDTLVKNHQKVVEIEEDEDEKIDVMEGEHEWAAVTKTVVANEVEDAGLREEDFSADADEEETVAGKEPASGEAVPESEE